MLVAVEGGVRFAVRVQPRAKKDQISGLRGGAIKIRVVAPPVDGAANKAVIRFVAKQLGVRKSAVRIVSGKTSRQKVIEVQDVTVEQVRAELLQTIV